MSTKNRFRTVEDKVRSIVASSLPDFKYLFVDYTQANVELDKLASPHVIYILPPSGTLLLRHDKFRDKPRTQLWFVCPTEFDFDGAVNDCLVESLKHAAMKFFSGLNSSGLFVPLEGALPYQVAYDAFDSNVTGVCFELELEEKDGVVLCNGELMV